MRQLYIIPQLDSVEESIALAKEYECAFEYNEFYLPEVLDDRDRQQEIIDAYRRTGWDFSKDTIHGAFFDVTVHSEDPLIRDASMMRVRQSMDIAKEMGARGVVFHTGRLAGFRVDYYLKHWKDANEEFWREIAEEYPKQEIFMENMFDEAGDVLGQLAERMRDVPNFGVCLDYAHAALTDCAKESWMRDLAPYIRHMHINDNDLSDDLHLAVGDGRIDWREFNKLAERCGLDASVLIEVKGAAAQRKSLEYMTRFGIYPMNQPL